MQTKKYSINIEASPEKVWDALWNSESYDEWATAFGEHQPIQTDWKKGSRVQFLGSSGEGMISEIAENKKPETMAFKHLGIVSAGKEDFESKEAKQWAGAKETYKLRPIGAKTELVVETDLADEYLDFFDKSWPEALDKIESLAED